MSEFVIDVGSYQWTVAGTNKDVRDDPNVNRYYQAAAISMELSGQFGARIKVQALDVAKDTATLEQLNQALAGNWIPAEWATVSMADQKARSDTLELVAAGNPKSIIALTKDAAKIALEPPVYTNYPAYPEYSSRPGWNGPGLYQDSAYGNFSVVTFDEYGYIDAITPVEANQIQLFQSTAPSQDQLDAWMPELETAAQKLTQTSQGKQAFLQDLIASMNKFLDLATNLFQRHERNVQDIVGRF